MTYQEAKDCKKVYERFSLTKEYFDRYGNFKYDECLK